MNPEIHIEIKPLQALRMDDILPVLSGYASYEKYAVEKRESDERILFDIRLVRLDAPYQDSFEGDFEQEEDRQRFAGYLPHGYSFGAYLGRRLVGFAICEVIDWNNSLRIWEFHVMPEFHHQGIGRQLMNHVISSATRDRIRVVFLETQSTNVRAIRFYRSLGFLVDALDLSLYTNHDVEDGQVCFFMKRKLE